MGRFSFSDEAVRELQDIPEVHAAPNLTSELETLIRSLEDWYGYGRFPKAKRANDTRAARGVRDDLTVLKHNLEQLTHTIDAIAKRERTRRALEQSTLSELMRYRGVSAWDDAGGVRELASKLLTRVADRLRPRV